jgi:hypothetical protein
MRLVIVACVLGLGVLAGSSLLGSARGETATADGPLAPVRTVSVQGVASVPIAQNADATEANAVYRQGMTDAISDGQSKAQLLASQTAATVGAVQSVTEDGGYIDCPEAEYEGQQPDFGSSGIGSPTVGFAGRTTAPAPAAHKGKAKSKHPKHKRAVKANVANCTLYTQVSLSYALS